MGLFSSKVVGVALTGKSREQKALKSTVKETGVDPEHLEYIEDKRSRTAKVVDTRSGETRSRFGW